MSNGEKGTLMSWKHFWIFAGGVAAAGVAGVAAQSKSVHNGAVRAAAACMRVSDAVSDVTQSVIDGAADLNAEARRETKINAAVKERLEQVEKDIRSEVEQQLDAKAIKNEAKA